MIDPLKLLKLIEERAVDVSEGVARRRYARFRADRWYGGIATADVVGCLLRCGMCWAWRKTSFVADVGHFYKPEEVASKLLEIAKRRGFKQMRISGGEPTIAPRHLLAVLDYVPHEYTFVVETNGILIDRTLAGELMRRPHVAIRVSIKGATAEEFERITMSPREFFYRQLDAIRNLIEAGGRPCVDVYPAAMLGFSTESSERSLLRELGKIDEKLPECLDVEYVILYPHVVRLMETRGLRPTRAVSPRGIPQFMV